MYKVTPQLYASAMWPLYCAFCTASGLSIELQLRFGKECAYTSCEGQLNSTALWRLHGDRSA
jgi:hypothetical protein